MMKSTMSGVEIGFGSRLQDDEAEMTASPWGER